VGLRRYLRLAKAGSDRCGAVRQYVGLTGSLKLDDGDVNLCESTLGPSQPLGRKP
jgi:hypothetical protein